MSHSDVINQHTPKEAKKNKKRTRGLNFICVGGGITALEAYWIQD